MGKQPHNSLIVVLCPLQGNILSNTADKTRTESQLFKFFPGWPNDGAKRVEKSTKECTPVIVHCYSLSDHGLNTDPKLNDGRNQTSSKETISWAPRQHASCVADQISPDGDDFRNEDVRKTSSAHLKSRETHACSHHCDKQPEKSPKVTDDELEDHEHVENRSTSIVQPPHALAKVITSVSQRSLLNPQVHLNGWETNLTQDGKNCPSSRRPLEYAKQPEKDERIQSSFGQRGLREWSNKHKRHGTASIVEMFDVYDGKRILVEKLNQDTPLSVQEKERGLKWNTQSAERKGGHHDDHRRKPTVQRPQLAGTACVDGPFRIQVFQQDTAVGSKKRKSRQPRPQRAKSDDAAHFQGETDDDMQGVQFGKERSENAFELRNQLQQRSPLSDGSHEEEDEEESERMTAMETHEDDQDSSRSNDKNRCDNRPVANTSSSGSRIFRREIPFDTLSPRCNTSRRRRIIEQSTSFFPEDQRQEVPWSTAISRNQRHENNISRECETMSSWKSDMTTKIAAKSRSKVLNDSDNKIPQLDAAQHLWRIPGRMTGRGNHNFEILEERRTSLANGRRKLTADVRMQYSQQCQHDMTIESGKRFPREARRKSYDSGRHDGVIEKGGHSTKNPRQPSEQLPYDYKLMSNSGGVPIVSAHKDELMLPEKSGQSLQTDLGDVQSEYNLNRLIEEQTRSFPGTQTNLLLHSRGVYATDLVPSVKERKFVCRFCCKKFAHFSTLQNHVRTHTGDKPFQCKFCSRRFAQSGVLKAHLRTHTGDKPFVCVYCRKTFAQSTTLTNHLRTHTGQKPYVCNYCGKSFSQPSTLRKHELSHTKERPYPCKFCGKAFAQQSTLTNHLRSHTGQRPYKCQFCEKSFAQLSTLDRHLRLHSTVSLKPHRCQYCAKSFSYFSNLASHMQVHQKEHTHD